MHNAVCKIIYKFPRGLELYNKVLSKQYTLCWKRFPAINDLRPAKETMMVRAENWNQGENIPQGNHSPKKDRSQGGSSRGNEREFIGKGRHIGLVQVQKYICMKSGENRNVSTRP